MMPQHSIFSKVFICNYFLQSKYSIMGLIQIWQKIKKQVVHISQLMALNKEDLSSGLTLPPLRCGVGFCRRMCGEDTLPVPSHTHGHWMERQPPSYSLSTFGRTQHESNLPLKLFSHANIILLFFLYCLKFFYSQNSSKTVFYYS